MTTILRMIHVVPVLLAICWVCPAFGETFRWVDDRGIIHYTDDFTRIPERYQPGALRIGTEVQEGKTGDQKQDEKVEGKVTDRLGRDESFWRGRVSESRDRLKALVEKNEEMRARYNELTTRFNDSKSSVERAAIKNERDRLGQTIEQNRAEIEEARIVLEKKIPEEADLYKAKPEWIK